MKAESKKNSSRESFFFICKMITIVCGLYNANKYFFPVDGNATWHLVFIGITVIVFYGLWKRPIWFLYFFGALVIQQWYSHGSYLMQLWQMKHIVDWKSIAVISLMPVIFIALIKEKEHASKVPSDS